MDRDWEDLADAIAPGICAQAVLHWWMFCLELDRHACRFQFQLFAAQWHWPVCMICALISWLRVVGEKCQHCLSLV